AVFGYGLGLALACGLLFGLIPALRVATAQDRNAAMSGRTAAPRAGSRLLVVSQVAVAVVLLASTLLLVRSTLELLDIDPGFDPDNLMTLRIGLSGAAYDDGARVVAFNHELVERVEALPGVIGAAVVDRIPLSGNLATTSLGLPEAASDADRVGTNVHLVTPGYFDVMGMRLLAGRGLAATDTATSQPVVVINEMTARALFGERSPLGRQVVTGGGRTLEIVGVVSDVKVHTIEEPAAPALYIHTDQLPSRSSGLVVRTADDPAALVNAVRAQVNAIDPAQDIYEVSSMRAMIDASPAMLTRTIPALLLSGFAAFATLLVGLGLFAIVAHDVAARTREIGIRRAIGALPASVVRDVTAGTLAVVALGIVVGSFAAVAAARLLQSILFGVGTADPLALVGTAAAVLIVAALACIVPVRRAVNIDPTEALRAE
ncbi:MAG: ABC transporter permease, partial [Acidobacteriota bacterium]